MIKLAIIDSERRKYLIDEISRTIVDYGLEEPINFFLEVYRPFPIMGELFFLSFFPMSGVFGKTVQDIVSLSSDSKNNITLIQKKVEELSLEKERKKALSTGEESSRPSLLTRLIRNARAIFWT